MKLDEKKKQIGNFAKYTGIGFQMLGIILTAVWIGTVCDEKFETNTPWFTVAFSLIGVFVSMYTVIKSLKNIK
ncbi:MAG: ATP synthase protein I [Sphingobacteriales bacterium]|jgi:ATP synthase protein I